MIVANFYETILEILRGENKQDIPQDYPVSDEVRKSMNKKLNQNNGWRKFKWY